MLRVKLKPVWVREELTVTQAKANWAETAETAAACLAWDNQAVHHKGGSLPPAPACDMPPSLICCKLPLCCARSLLQPGWGKRQSPKRKNKGIYCDFPFLSFVGDWDWALSQTSGLWQWSGERSALQATKHKERERTAVIKWGRGWSICLDCIVKITGEYASELGWPPV